MEPPCHSDRCCSALTSNKHIFCCAKRNKTWDASAASDSIRGDGTRFVAMGEKKIQWNYCIFFQYYVLLSAEWCAFTGCLSFMIASQWEKARRQMGGGMRLQFCAPLWLVTTPQPSRWAWATGRMCVCMSPQSWPLPLLSTAAPSFRLQYTTDLVAKVTSSVDEFTSVLMTT